MHVDAVDVWPPFYQNIKSFLNCNFWYVAKIIPNNWGTIRNWLQFPIINFDATALIIWKVKIGFDYANVVRYIYRTTNSSITSFGVVLCELVYLSFLVQGA